MQSCTLDLHFINKKGRNKSPHIVLNDKCTYLFLLSKLHMVSNSKTSHINNAGCSNDRTRNHIRFLINHSFTYLFLYYDYCDNEYTPFPLYSWINNWLNMFFTESNCLSKMSKLAHSNLSWNYFDNEILRFLGALPVLKSLDLSNNQMEGPLLSHGTCKFKFSSSRIL